MIALRPSWSSAILAVVLTGLVAYGAGWLHGLSRAGERQKLQEATASATSSGSALDLVRQQRRDELQPLNNYVTRLEKANAPVEVIRDRLVRYCPQQLRQPSRPSANRLPVPAGNPGQPADEAAAAHAAARGADQLAEQIHDAVMNGIQLDELQAQIRANTAQGDVP